MNTQPANDNMRAAKGGEAYWPEMGGRSDGSALFEMTCTGDFYVKWLASRHDEAMAAFKAHRIRPRAVERFTSEITGEEKFSCIVTYAAGLKLRAAKLAVTLALLD